MEREFGGLRFTGSSPRSPSKGPVRGPQHVFVNRRIVKDRTIAHAIIDAYSVATNKERSPEVHLFLEVPPDRVDVNVHPTKAEVRFREQSMVHEMVRRAVGDALGKGPAPELTLRASDIMPGPPAAAVDSRRARGRQFHQPLGTASSSRRSAPGFQTGVRARGFRRGADGGSTRRLPPGDRSGRSGR